MEANEGASSSGISQRREELGAAGQSQEASSRLTKPDFEPFEDPVEAAQSTGYCGA